MFYKFTTVKVIVQTCFIQADNETHFQLIECTGFLYKTYQELNLSWFHNIKGDHVGEHAGTKCFS